MYVYYIYNVHIQPYTYMYTVYQVHIWPRHSPLTEAVFLGPRRCTTWSWDWWPTWPMAAWQKIGWRKLGSCTAQLLIQSGLGAMKMFHTIDTQLMICTQSSPKTWATWHQMRKLCCGEGWPLRLAQAHMGSQSRKVKKDILMISCSTLLVFLFTPAWINRPVRCQVSISIARMARLAT